LSNRAVIERPLLRWSSTRDCPRKAIYEATDAPARPLIERERRILFRGKRIGRDYAELLSLNHNNKLDHKRFIRARVRAEEKGGGYYGAGKVWVEKKVVWPLGVGHMDIWLPQTATAVEVLSSAHASEQMVHSKELQLVGYMEHDPETTNGAVVVLNPSDYSEDKIILSRHSKDYAELVEEMHERIRQVQEWDATGEMPPRVCRKPADARGHFCVYADHCFDGWTPDPATDLTDPAIAELVAQLAAAKLRYREHDKQAEAERDEYKEIEQQLTDLGIQSGRTYRCGTWQFRRITVKGRETFQLARARKAGFWTGADDERFANFLSVGAPSERYEVDRASEAGELALADDDEVPF